ncbi:hypothetical protein UlMin_006299 [Ulmus minor]
MKEEVEALQINKTWVLLPFSSSYNLIGSKWVFKVKYNVDEKTQILMVLIYVDDMIITSRHNLSLQKFVKRLHCMFALKDMGNLHHFLGIEVKRDVTGMYLTQTRYIEELLKKTEMENTQPCPTLVVVGRSLTASDRELLNNPMHYRSLIGAL